MTMVWAVTLASGEELASAVCRAGVRVTGLRVAVLAEETECERVTAEQIARYETPVGDYQHHVERRSCGAITDVGCAVPTSLEKESD